MIPKPIEVRIRETQRRLYEATRGLKLFRAEPYADVDRLEGLRKLLWLPVAAQLSVDKEERRYLDPNGRLRRWEDREATNTFSRLSRSWVARRRDPRAPLTAPMIDIIEAAIAIDEALIDVAMRRKAGAARPGELLVMVNAAIAEYERLWKRLLAHMPPAAANTAIAAMSQDSRESAHDRSVRDTLKREGIGGDHRDGVRLFQERHTSATAVTQVERDMWDESDGRGTLSKTEFKKLVKSRKGAARKTSKRDVAKASIVAMVLAEPGKIGMRELLGKLRENGLEIRDEDLVALVDELVRERRLDVPNVRRGQKKLLAPGPKAKVLPDLGG